MHNLPDLPYDFNALEPSIDARTMELHHGKHHNTYVTKLNRALEAAGGPFGDWDLRKLLANLGELPEAQRTGVRNNGGGHYNHSLFWTVMSNSGGSKPSGDLAGAIDIAFGSFDSFQEEFSQVAVGRFGSGWAWLSLADGGLMISSTPNQDNPIMDGSGDPILGLDVWEHAYYLKYQNRRPDYIKAWWDVVSWDEVARRYAEAVG
jgi:Fe-Mn family superoxide dismutase